MLSALWYFLTQKGYISSGLAFWLTLLNLPLAAAASYGLVVLVGRGSMSFVNTIYAWGDNAPMEVTYPRQDALIARGEYAEAAGYFRDHIRVTPEDLEARLRLAALLEKHLQGDEEAERLYLEVRKLAKQRNHHFAASNGLIDLYRRTGRDARLRVELRRFAERYPTTSPPHSPT